MRAITLLFALVGLSFYAQAHLTTGVLLPPEYAEQDSVYTNLKGCPSEFSNAARVALSFYPELQQVSITFRYARIRTTMETRPFFRSMLTGKRHYVIYMKEDGDTDGILLRDAPFNAQVGIIGHELAHILDYEHRNLFSMIGLGAHYLIHKSFAAYERSIDHLTVSRGMGWQLLSWSDFVFNRSKASERYKAFKRKNYLSPVEIRSLIAGTELNR